MTDKAVNPMTEKINNEMMNMTHAEVVALSVTNAGRPWQNTDNALASFIKVITAVMVLTAPLAVVALWKVLWFT